LSSASVIGEDALHRPPSRRKPGNRGWRKLLILMQLNTVVRCHRAGFKLYWKWISRSRARVGRRSRNKEIREWYLTLLLACDYCGAAPRFVTSSGFREYSRSAPPS
jgi:hypothetical protein